MKTPKTQEEMIKIVNEYMSENTRLLQKHGLIAQLVVNFPKKKRIPRLSKIALWLLRIQGGILDIKFYDSEK